MWECTGGEGAVVTGGNSQQGAQMLGGVSRLLLPPQLFLIQPLLDPVPLTHRAQPGKWQDLDVAVDVTDFFNRTRCAISGRGEHARIGIEPRQGRASARKPFRQGAFAATRIEQALAADRPGEAEDQPGMRAWRRATSSRFDHGIEIHDQRLAPARADERQQLCGRKAGALVSLSSRFLVKVPVTSPRSALPSSTVLWAG